MAKTRAEVAEAFGLKRPVFQKSFEEVCKWAIGEESMLAPILL